LKWQPQLASRKTRQKILQNEALYHLYNIPFWCCMHVFLRQHSFPLSHLIISLISTAFPSATQRCLDEEPGSWSSRRIPRGDLQATFLFKGFEEVRRLGLQRATEASIRAAELPTTPGAFHQGFRALTFCQTVLHIGRCACLLSCRAAHHPRCALHLSLHDLNSFCQISPGDRALPRPPSVPPTRRDMLSVSQFSCITAGAGYAKLAARP